MLSTYRQSRPALLAAVTAFSLAACGGGAPDAAAPAAAPATPAPDSAAPAPAAGPAASASANLSEGPDVCFKAVSAHLGADVKVSEIMSSFDPEGRLQVCTADYQSPEDPRKLVGVRMDPASGGFSGPYPIELSVSGNAADFRLDDYLIPLSQVDAAALAQVMQAQEAELGGTYSSVTWTAVRLVPPGAFSDKHTLRLDMEGRLAANDIKNNGYASVSVDGTTITANHLMP